MNSAPIFCALLAMVGVAGTAAAASASASASQVNVRVRYTGGAALQHTAYHNCSICSDVSMVSADSWASLSECGAQTPRQLGVA